MPDNVQRSENVNDLHSLLQKDESLQVFRDALSPEDLRTFAQKAKFVTHEQGERVVEQGEKATRFFIVLDGQLRAVDVSHETPHLLGYIVRGEIIGVRALMMNKVRSSTVEVVISSKLAVFDEETWFWLVGRNSQIRDFFENLEKNREEQARKKFPGRQWDEVVVVATKRHFIAYIATLPLPLTLLIAPLLLFLLGEVMGVNFLNAIADSLFLLATLPFVIIALLLIIYNYFDWLNDDFIVTTKRVIHIERILFFGEQRRDAPLTRIQDVTVESDFLDLLFDSDTLRIATAGSGIITFDNIRKAHLVHQAIFRERERAKARVAAADIAAVRHNLADQLNWDDRVEQNVMAIAEAEAYLTHEPETHHYGRFIDFFIPRMKEVNDTGNGTVVIWRKHFVILFINVILPLIILLISTYLFVASIVLWLPPFTAFAAPVQVILGVAILVSIVWYFAKYDDWHRDQYMVTSTQIIDIDSSAFRIRRTRREGTFDNIQAVYSEVPNFFAKIVNMGDVIIETAGTEDTFTFKKVYDPASVTKEVFNRWSLYQQREREAQRDSTHSQVMEVLREYHYLSKKSDSSAVGQQS